MRPESSALRISRPIPCLNRSTALRVEQMDQTELSKADEATDYRRPSR